VKSAVKANELLTVLGVHVHVAVVVAATEVQPEIAVPAALNVTLPGVLTAAVIVTGVP
jgi:hypothetical protein